MRLHNVQNLSSFKEKKHKVTDNESLNPAIEKRCDFKYYFPSSTEPNNTGGTYYDEAAFATALLSHKLLFYFILEITVRITLYLSLIYFRFSLLLAMVTCSLKEVQVFLSWNA